MNEITTTDLRKFGQRELKELELIIKAIREHGLPEDFDSDGIHPMFNMSSGNVFLTNSCYFEVAMLTDEGKLAKWHTCTECDNEGFYEDFILSNNECCLKRIKG